MVSTNVGAHHPVLRGLQKAKEAASMFTDCLLFVPRTGFEPVLPP